MNASHQQVSTRELLTRIKDKNHLLLDIRPIEAYNGWKIQGEARGGHIESAIAFPLKWTGYDSWINLLKDKGLKQDAPVTVYGYERDKAGEMADKLQEAGYQEISLYHNFKEEWSADESLPMDRLERYHQLVHPGWLHALFHGEQPE